MTPYDNSTCRAIVSPFLVRVQGKSRNARCEGQRFLDPQDLFALITEPVDLRSAGRVGSGRRRVGRVDDLEVEVVSEMERGLCVGVGRTSEKVVARDSAVKEAAVE